MLREEERDLQKKIGIGMEDANTRPRLREIELILKVSEDIKPVQSDKLEVGYEFTVSLDYGDDDKDLHTGILVEEKVAANSNLTSIASPLGKAIVGRRIGENFNYTVQKDFHVNGRILDANIPTIERAREIVKTK